QLGNKNLTITAGQFPINGINSNNISFINIQAFRLNINNTYASAGIDKISQILSSWNAFVNNSKLVLGVEFGGVVEIVSSSNIKSDIENQHLQPVNGTNFNFPFTNNEQISDQCGYSSYAYWSWRDLSSQLSSFCPTNLISSSQWAYGFISNASQPYLYQQNLSSKYYYVTFYEDYQSLNAKLDYIKRNNLAGVAIADITKDSKDLQLTNFTSGILPNKPGENKPTGTSPPTPTSSTSQSSPPNTGTIAGGVIGSIIFVGALVAVGIILYRRRHKPGKVVTTVIAMFDYVGKETNDLSFKAGDVIEVLEKGDGPNDWWVGRLHGAVGEFP
ncbi:20322_t:CDS:2, partial [Racocetra persica]